MKVKVKWDGQRKLVNFEDRSVSDVTLRELKENVSNLYNAQGIPFELSLNRQDALQGEDRALSEFGLVSGDLLHVVGATLPASAVMAHDSEMTPSSSSVENNSQFSETVPESMSFEEMKQDHEKTTTSDEDAIAEDLQKSNYMDATDTRTLFYSDFGSTEVNRWLAEPLVMRESTGSAVPILLSQLYSSAGCVSGLDAVWVAVHCLMLEAGFCTDQSCETSTCMPDKWKCSGYYRSAFSYPLAPGTSVGCCVTGVTLGSTVAVHGVTVNEGNDSASFSTDIVHLQSCQYIRGESITDDVVNTYRALDRLSLLIKDKICLPLINELATSAGYREKQGLLAMPKEVLLRICSCLDAQSLCRLGETCVEMGEMYKDRVLWRRMYMLYFPVPSNCTLSQDWFQIYKQQTLIYKQRQEEIRQHRAFLNRPDGMWVPPMFPFGPHPMMPPPPPPFPFPHMIGGEHDLHPGLVAGPPHPRNVFPNRGGPPFPRPGQDPLMGPGLPGFMGNRDMQGGRRGNNLTGSPFFHQGGFF